MIYNFLFFFLSLFFSVLEAQNLSNPPLPSLTEDQSVRKIEEAYTKATGDPEALLFTPPEGWAAVDPKQLTPRVKLMVIGKGAKEYPPSINLGTEPYKGTIKDYYKTIKAINEAQGAEWKDLGQIQTQAGNASLSQVDMRTEWGDVRLMHAILIKSGQLYVVTAAALKEEFATFYKDFFSAFRSLRFNKDAYEMIANVRRRKDLQKSVQELTAKWSSFYEKQKTMTPHITPKEAFSLDPFEHDIWNPFTTMIEKDFSDMTPNWRQHFILKTQNQLINSVKD